MGWEEVVGDEAKVEMETNMDVEVEVEIDVKRT
jgi:hypothetical protein